MLLECIIYYIICIESKFKLHAEFFKINIVSANLYEIEYFIALTELNYLSNSLKRLYLTHNNALAKLYYIRNYREQEFNLNSLSLRS